MTQAEFTTKLKDVCGEDITSKAAAERLLKAVGAIVADELEAGGDVTIPGVGTFSVGKREARKGRNPQTGEIIKIKACKYPKFKASAALKRVVNNK